MISHAFLCIRLQKDVYAYSSAPIEVFADCGPFMV